MELGGATSLYPGKNSSRSIKETILPPLGLTGLVNEVKRNISFVTRVTVVKVSFDYSCHNYSHRGVTAGGAWGGPAPPLFRLGGPYMGQAPPLFRAGAPPEIGGDDLFFFFFAQQLFLKGIFRPPHFFRRPPQGGRTF